MGNPLFPGSSAPGLRGGSLTLSSSKSSKSAGEYDASPHPGIINLGNTCFLNSVLQAIGNTRDFQLLIQGSPSAAPSGVDATSIQPYSSILHTKSWPDRLQSPALRVSDDEHGRSISHSSTASSLTVSSSPNSSIPDPLATVKAESIPLPSAKNATTNTAAARYEPSVTDLPLNTAFRHVLEKIWDESRKTRSTHINPKRLLNLLGKKYDQYLEYGQQDGHELMRHLLDACRMEELDMIKKMQPAKSKTSLPHSPSHDRAGMDQTASNAPTSGGLESDEQLIPFLDLLFCGKLASMVVCEGCRKVSHTYEDFYDLSLSLRDDASGSKARKGSRLRSMADRWRRATQAKPTIDSPGGAVSAQDTPVGTPAFSENEGSDVDTTRSSRKTSGFLSPDEGRSSRFQLRKRSVRHVTQPEPSTATSGSEMEPDFPDMASLSLAPVSAHHKERRYGHANMLSASEDNSDGHPRVRPLTVLPIGSVAHSRDSSPGSPITAKGMSAPDSSMKPPTRPAKPATHQANYIARILSESNTTVQPSTSRRPGSAPDSSLTTASAASKPLHDLLRRGVAAASKLPSSDFETDPNSAGARRRRKIQDEQLSSGLIASLIQFTSVEILEGENSFACKNCWRLANPPTARERDELRRRRRRRAASAIDDGDDEEDPSGSSGLESDDDRFAPMHKARISTSGDEVMSSTNDSQSVLASSSVDSDVAVSASAPFSAQAATPMLSMTPLAGSDVSRGLSASSAVDPGDSSFRSEVESSAAGTDNELGPETDASFPRSTIEESATSGGETSGVDTEDRERARIAGVKRSAQSLPRRALKRYLIASAPPVLIFHLKRFQSTGRGFVSGLAGFKKIDDQVTFPEFVDITPWLAPPREDYDRRGRLKATSDPLAIRKRAEEEARKAGMDARNVQVEVQARHSRFRHGRHYTSDGPAGHKHAKWSWHVREPTKGKADSSSTTLPSSSEQDHSNDGGDVEEGPEVKVAGGSEIIPSVIQRPKTEYRLYAVIVHQGSLSAGHYTAYILSDRVKLRDSKKELIARSAPTSRTTTPAPSTGLASTASSQLGRRESLNFSQYFMGGSNAQKPPRTAASPAPPPASSDVAAPTSVPIRPASARPASVAPASAAIAPTSLSSSSSSAGSNIDIMPQTSTSSLETDRSKTSSISFSDGPKIVRPKPQLKRMQSWNSLDELDAPNGSATPTNNASEQVSIPRPTGAEPRRTHAPSAECDEDSIDKRKVDDGRRWVYTSDTTVRAANIEEVLKAKAYMLFYERV